MLSLERSGYYAWLKRKPSKRQQANEILDEKIVSIYKKHKSRYGAPRIADELHANGEICGENRVKRRMKHLDIRAPSLQQKQFSTFYVHTLPHGVTPQNSRSLFWTRTQAYHENLCGVW